MSMAAAEAYNEANSLDESTIRTGLSLEDIPNALSDDRTIFAGDSRVPLAVPIEHYSVFNPLFFRGRIQDLDRRPLYAYAGSATLAKVLEIDPVEMVRGMVEELSEQGAVLAYEQSDQRDVRRVLLDSLKGLPRAYEILRFQDEDERGGGVIYPSHYLYDVWLSGNPTDSISNVFEAYAAMQNDTPAVLERTLSKEEIAESFINYKKAFARAERHSPLKETLDETSYLDFMEDDNFWKIVIRDHQGIANLSVICPIDELAWMNQAAIARTHPELYEAGRVLGAPITFSRPDAAPRLSMQAMKFISLLFSQLGEHLIIGEAHDLSKWLAQQFSITTTSGQAATITVEGPVVVQTVEALAL